LRIVVSGAAGFIGSHMCDRLLAEGHAVVGIDNFLTGSRRNLAHLAIEPRFRLIRQDITQPFPIEGPVDCVANLASPASPKDYLEHPIETLDAGSLGTRRMLELALEKGARFLLTSTSECYGDPLEHPQVETYWGNVNPVGPRSCYDESKRFAEAITMAYQRKHGVRTSIARIFNTYGPRMKLGDGRVVPAFLDQALRGQPLTVFGDGSQTRSMTGSHSPIVFQPLPEDDPQQRCPDIGKARAVLGWEPRVPLDEGLRPTVEYFHGLHATVA
jgi:dTDP-glucose 4,6-dehydratase